MTNHWNDIDNTSLVFVFGANPAENHPACMAHVNAARYGDKTAKLIVVDPRKTRTALQINPANGDMYVRIRPGTNVAFSNGLLNWIMNNTTYNATVVTRMLAWHNGTLANSVVGRGFIDDAGAAITPSTSGSWTTGLLTPLALATGYPKYCDTRHVVNALGIDYLKATFVQGAQTISNFPVIAPTITSQVDGMDTVWTSLIAHLAPYTTATVAGICGCTEAEIVAVAQALLDNSRFASNDYLTGMAAASATPQDPAYKATTILYAMGQTQHTNGSQNIKDLAMIQTILGNMGRPGGGINALRGIHNVQGSTDMGTLYDSIPAYSANPGVDEHYSHYQNSLFGNRVEGTGAVAYQDPTFADASKLGLQQRGFHNMTNEWFGKGVSSGADMAKLYDLWPKGNGVQHITTFRRMADSAVKTAALTVGAGTSAVTFTAVASGDIGNAVYITMANGTPNATLGITVTGKEIVIQLGTDGSSAVTSTAAVVAAVVNGTPAAAALVGATAGGTGMAAIKTRTPLAGGVDKIRAAVCWGQNPAVTEPNQSKVRDGLKNLDLLVVVDMFETETASCERKTGAPTYLIPACAHVEEAGSVTNSGRWLQWRERACAPKGNSKADIELLLRFAYALDQANAFSHIVSFWGTGLTTPIVPAVSGKAYAELYGKYGWKPTDATKFEALSTTTEMWPARDYLGILPITGAPVTAPVNKLVYGSEVITEAIYKEVCRPLNYVGASGLAGDFSTLTGGTMWIYSGAGTGGGADDTTGQAAYNPAGIGRNVMPAVTSAGNTVNWLVANKAKSRNNVVKGNDANGANNYPRWGWAWLLNRRVFYNNGEVSGDQSDNFVSPGLVSCLFTMNSAATALADWSLVYRKYKTMADAPESTLVKTGAGRSPHYIADNKTFMGRFPGHTEPYETPREADLGAAWGHNTSGGVVGSLLTTGDGRGTVANFPLVLTSIRCVEHFQGGPITRNNSWNVEAEPVPWIEINPVDALAAVPPISDGDWVNVKTFRSNSTTDQEAHTPGHTGWARGFKARVGVGLQSNQRVAPGVVAIPWHWGDKGLSTGSRANDLCIDAWDANTQIPEYKACLCSIEKII